MKILFLRILSISLFLLGGYIAPRKSVSFDNLQNVSKVLLASILGVSSISLWQSSSRKKYAFLINTGKYKAEITNKKKVLFSTTSLCIEIEKTPYAFVSTDPKIGSILMSQFKEGEIVTILVNSEDGNECVLSHKDSCVSGYIRKHT